MLYYKRHIGDYIRDTAHLSLIEHGAYARLMDVYYGRESPLPQSDVFRLVGARGKEEMAAVRSILAEFWTLTDSGWVQGRCDREIGKARDKADLNRVNGKRGGRPRKTETQPKPTGNPDGNPEKTDMVSVGNPNETLSHYPISPLTHKPITPSIRSESPRESTKPTNNPHGFGQEPSGIPAESGNKGQHSSPPDDSHDAEAFQILKAAYPKGIYRQSDWLEAEREVRSRVDEGVSWADLQAAVHRYADQVVATGRLGTQAVLSPKRFFSARERCWLEEFPLPAAGAQRKTYADYERESANRLAAAAGDDPGPL